MKTMSTRFWVLLACLVCGAGGLWWVFRRKRQLPPPNSIVVLLKESRALSQDTLATLAGRALGRPVNSIHGASPLFLLNIGGAFYTLHNVASPYFDSSEKATEHIGELRLRKAVRDHKACIAIDITSGAARGKPTAQEYQTIGKILAELEGPDWLALYHPPTDSFIPYIEKETVAHLRAQDPIESLFHNPTVSPVIPIDDDPRMKAAEAEAKRRFPEFKAAFAKRSSEFFSIKTLIKRGSKGEHIWVDVDSMTDGAIEGRLGNEPVELEGLKLGSPVQVPVSEVEDWAIQKQGSITGAFTMPVLEIILKERKKP